jgi:serine/threonine protein phosphatase PrpC
VTDLRVLSADSLRAAARTHPGRVRQNNEDLPLVDAARGIFGVIDGIGGHAGGEIAAATARDVVLQRLARPLGTPAERVREAIAIANNEIHRRAQEASELGGMACVMTVALVADGWLTIGHVGDTRLYTMTREGLRKLTRDHSPVGEREDAGELSEVDAMRHPRRHEVFRDVGTIPRDKDEGEFVDVVEQPLERDSAILICSDGLTDMLPASTVAHIVRQHAGDPERVVEALVGAANDAGGRDNVTVVYAEAPRFADAIGRSAGEELTPTEAPPPKTPEKTESAEGPEGAVRRAARAIVRSRTTWFFAGTLLGVVGATALMLYVARTQVRAPQTLVVGAGGPEGFARIMEAVSVARPGDVVRVEPGAYEELVVLGSGADLVARIPGSVTILRPAGAPASAPVLTIAGALNVRVSGIRIEAAANDSPDLAVRVASPAAALELVEIAGPFKQVIGLSETSAVAVHGSHVAVSGSLVSVPADGQLTLVNSIIERAGGSQSPAIVASPAASLTVRGNVFRGFGAAILAGVGDARRAEVLDPNTIVPADPPRGSTPSGSRGRGGRGR